MFMQHDIIYINLFVFNTIHVLQKQQNNIMYRNPKFITIGVFTFFSGYFFSYYYATRILKKYNRYKVPKTTKFLNSTTETPKEPNTCLSASTKPTDN